MAKVIIEGAPLSNTQAIRSLKDGAWFTVDGVVMLKVACHTSADYIAIEFCEDGLTISKWPRETRVVPIKGPDHIVVRWED